MPNRWRTKTQRVQFSYNAVRSGLRRLSWSSPENRSSPEHSASAVIRPSHDRMHATPQQFVDHTAKLLTLEREAEIRQSTALLAELSASELQARGLALLGLEAQTEDYGLGGQTEVVLARIDAQELPAHKFRPGDRVQLTGFERNRGRNIETRQEAVVHRIRRGDLRVRLSSDADIPRPPVRLDRVTDDVTHRRLQQAVAELGRFQRGPPRRVIDVAFGQRDPTIASGDSFDVDSLPSELDASQTEAVRFALDARELALIHGPPGTGKTTAVAAAIEAAARRGERVLACAPSNIAVDNIVERLAERGLKILRMGHPARLLPSVVEHALETQVAAAEGSSIATSIRREIDLVGRRLSRSRDRSERREHRDARRRLFRELRELERRTIRNVIDGAEVVLATCTGAGEPLLAETTFDVAVIDEAGQAIEAACWIPLLKAGKAILAGDHLQLPPTILSPDAADRGLSTTLFERMHDRYAEKAARMLTVQYRMHESIMRWSSDALYEGRLTAHRSVESHLLSDLPHVESTDETTLPLVLIDTAGCDLEEDDTEGDSRSNAGEAQIAVQHTETLITAGVRPEEIAVITPYNAQAQRLRNLLNERWGEIEVGSVDGFQGREKEAVVLSLVRSNPRQVVGFLADHRRINVAITRARRHVAVIGDSATVTSDRFLANLFDHFQAHGEYRSAWDYYHG